jgi:hypothetical protein
MSDAHRTYYEILGILEDASPEDVSAARRSMLRQVHPDLATDEADRLEREQLSRAVNDMCDTLLDPVRRYDYDVALARARDPAGRGPSRVRPPATHRHRAPDAGHDEGAYGPWLDESEWFTDVPAGPHPIVSRVPAMAPLEPWLTWPVGILGLVMIGVATLIYDAAGARFLDAAGLHIGRFGSLAVVVALALLLVVLWLGTLSLARAIGARLRRGRPEPPGPQGPTPIP